MTGNGAGPGATPPVEIRGLRRSYGSTVALAGLDLDLRPGEVLGIAGPNGAGKSTLVRILAGEETADGGTILSAGRAWSPADGWGAVAVVHQEPQVFPNLTVAENVLAGREGTRARRPKPRGSDLQVMAALGIAGVADKLLGDCTLATQQRTEIARAIARDARIFLFDEPNSALTDEESDELFREMHKLARSGRIVLLVTHRLGDLVEHAARVAVVRDGRVRTVLEGAGLTEEAIAQQMVTESAVDAAARGGGAGAEAANVDADDDAVVRVSGWCREAAFQDIRLTARRGEILAFMGVEGSGARELLRSLAGLERCTGAIEIEGATGDRAIRRHSAYVPATRALSLYSHFSVGENLLVRLGRPSIAGAASVLRKRQMQRLAAEAVDRFLVKTRTLTQGIRSLSGGNQQKVAIAQALNCAPRLLLLEEPTRGVDIRSKREIYRLLRDYADRGNAVILFCTEVLEIYEAADRVLVVSDGRLSRPLSVRDYDQVEALATDITALERHGRDGAAAAA